MQPDPQQGPAQRFAHGTRVTATVTGVVMNNGGGRGSRDVFHGAQRVRDDDGFDHWLYPYSDVTPVIVVDPAPPAVAPGQLWMTADGAFMTRISRPELPLRMTPADLTAETGLKTVDTDTFFEIYPDAILLFDPNPPDALEAEPFAIPVAGREAVNLAEPVPLLLLGGDAKHSKTRSERFCHSKRV